MAAAAMKNVDTNCTMDDEATAAVVTCCTNNTPVARHHTLAWVLARHSVISHLLSSRDGVNFMNRYKFTYMWQLIHPLGEFVDGQTIVNSLAK